MCHTMNNHMPCYACLRIKRVFETEDEHERRYCWICKKSICKKCKKSSAPRVFNIYIVDGSYNYTYTREIRLPYFNFIVPRNRRNSYLYGKRYNPGELAKIDAPK